MSHYLYFRDRRRFSFRTPRGWQRKVPNRSRVARRHQSPGLAPVLNPERSVKTVLWAVPAGGKEIHPSCWRGRPGKMVR